MKEIHELLLFTLIMLNITLYTYYNYNYRRNSSMNIRNTSFLYNIPWSYTPSGK